MICWPQKNLTYGWPLGVGGNEVMNDDRHTASIALALRIVTYQTLFPLKSAGLVFSYGTAFIHVIAW